MKRTSGSGTCDAQAMPLHQRVDGLRRLHETSHAEGSGQHQLNQPEQDVHGWI